MSTNDITLNGHVYSWYSGSGKQVIRRCSLATLPADFNYLELEISHIPATASKAGRHLASFKWETKCADNVYRTFRSYSIFLDPAGASLADNSTQFAATSTIIEDKNDLEATAGFVSSVVAGGFSA